MISEPQGQSGQAGGVQFAKFNPCFVECYTCGYEPEHTLSVFQGRCPKCHAFTWRRLPRKGGPLEAVDRAVRGYAGKN
jgi:hypothetical protein